jgi:hypothetical protein
MKVYLPDDLSALVLIGVAAMSAGRTAVDTELPA